MPAKGSVQRHGNRDYVLNKKFYEEKLVKEGKTTLPYSECINIIHHANKIIADAVKKEIDGFKLPFGMGYLCCSKYIPKKPTINWLETNKLFERGIRKYVYNTNMHTEGYACRIVWYRVGKVDNAHFHEIYKFKAVKLLSAEVSDLFKNGKNYHAWEVSDFINKGRLENLYNKRYRNNLNTISNG